ncbi:hypothetical protein pb186bvf_017112 [Paramecium bursaria]
MIIPTFTYSLHLILYSQKFSHLPPTLKTIYTLFQIYFFYFKLITTRQINELEYTNEYIASYKNAQQYKCITLVLLLNRFILQQSQERNKEKQIFLCKIQFLFLQQINLLFGAFI